MAKWTYGAVVIRPNSMQNDRLAVDGSGMPKLFAEHDWKGPEELQKQLAANGLRCETVKVTIETEKPQAAGN